jgi:hypothetical protein
VRPPRAAAGAWLATLPQALSSALPTTHAPPLPWQVVEVNTGGVVFFCCLRQDPAAASPLKRAAAAAAAAPPTPPPSACATAALYSASAPSSEAPSCSAGAASSPGPAPAGGRGGAAPGPALPGAQQAAAAAAAAHAAVELYLQAAAELGSSSDSHCSALSGAQPLGDHHQQPVSYPTTPMADAQRPAWEPGGGQGPRGGSPAQPSTSGGALPACLPLPACCARRRCISAAALDRVPVLEMPLHSTAAEQQNSRTAAEQQQSNSTAAAALLHWSACAGA